MKTIIKIFLLVLIFQQTIMAQTGDEFFEKKDYRNAAIRYEIEVMTNADAYENLAKSYFALKDFDQAAEAGGWHQAVHPDKEVSDDSSVDTAGLGAVGAYRSLREFTELGGVLTVFALPKS